MKRPREVTIAEAVEVLAKAFGVTLKPAGGNTFSVPLLDMQLRVDIEMKVCHQASSDDARHYRETALEMIADPDRGGWTDGCDTNVKDRGHFAMRGAVTGCKKPVIGVVVTKHFDQIGYSFRCHCHMDRPSRDNTKIVYRDVMKQGLDLARTRRNAALKAREEFRNKSEIEKIADDAKSRGPEVVKAILAQRVVHSYRCMRLRTSPEDFRSPGYPDGDDSVACTCGAAESPDGRPTFQPSPSQGGV